MISLRWIQAGFTHYLPGITLILTLVAANPYRPPKHPVARLHWPLQILVAAAGSLVKLTPEENWYDMAETVAQQMVRLQLEVQNLQVQL